MARRWRARWAAVGLILLGGMGAGQARAFVLELEASDFTVLTPVFSNVQSFQFAIELPNPVQRRIYRNEDVIEVQYIVNGSLSTSPPTPSGFPAFFLDRTPAREGPIDAANWIEQGSFLDFEVSPSADLTDGIQLSELVPDAGGVILEIDGREYERLDRARYHPPLLVLFDDGTGVLQNSNNSSGRTGTVNPATMVTVDVDFGDEYITDLTFAPAAVTIVPEPGASNAGAAALLAVLAAAHRRRR